MDKKSEEKIFAALDAMSKTINSISTRLDSVSQTIESMTVRVKSIGQKIDHNDTRINAMLIRLHQGTSARWYGAQPHSVSVRTRPLPASQTG